MTNNPTVFSQHPPGWKFDLCSPNSPPKEVPNIDRIWPPPNTLNTTFLELPRSSLQIRGLGLAFGILLAIMTFISPAFFIYVSIIHSHIDFSSTLIGLGVTTVCCWLSAWMIRLDLEHPRDEPIRFNRARRKVYFYQYRHDLFSVFCRGRWGLKPIAYDWDDLIAEASSVYAPSTSGLVENITIAVRKPGTDEVIDRLFFAHCWDKGEKYWALAQLFMRQGSEALPEFYYAAQDWNDDDNLSLMHRLAPKVRWPAAMDLESRTAPTSGEHP